MTEQQYETTTAPLIDHMLAPMLNEQGRGGWELVDVADDLTAELRRPTGGGPAWEYATVPLIPAARDAIVAQWVDQGYELALERAGVGYFKRPKEG